jgi:hypothetical protein
MDIRDVKSDDCILSKETASMNTNNKKICIATLALLFLGLLSLASEAQELDGFRGVMWGQNLSSFSYMKFLDEFDSLRYYKKMNDKMYLGSAGLDEIAYAFESNRFVGAVLSSNGQENAQRIFETLNLAYGTPSKQNDNNCYWPFGEVCVFYNYNPSSKRLFVSYLTETAIKKKRRWKRI